MKMTFNQFSLFQIDSEQKKLLVGLPEMDQLLHLKGTNHTGIINLDGTVTQPFYDQEVKIEIEYKVNAETIVKAHTIKVKGSVGSTQPSAWPLTVPTVQQWQPFESQAEVALTSDYTIIVLSDSLYESAQLFQEDLKLRGLELSLSKDSSVPAEGKFIVFTDMAPVAVSDETYYMEISSEQITIYANHSTGAYYATRTLLQLDLNRLPSGVIYDYPRYEHRGFMLDVGRKFMPFSHLLNIVDNMAYYKLNDFQLHLNDNYIFLAEHIKDKNLTPQEEIEYVLQHAVEGFRVPSTIQNSEGIKLTSEDHYTTEELDELAVYAAKRGVKIVPEIDTPGHALSITKVRPDLIYQGSLSKGKHPVERAAMLDLGENYEQTLAFVTQLFDELLDEENGPLRNFDTIHIGTDEYYGHPEHYRKYVNDLIHYIKAKGFTPRIWGSFTQKKGDTEVNLEGTEVHIWNIGWQNPAELIGSGAKLINIVDNPTYSVPSGKGDIAAYGDYSDYIAQYNQWTPHHFDLSGQTNFDDTLQEVVGGAFAIWNDNIDLHETGITSVDIFQRFMRTLPVVAERTWNSPFAQPTYEAFNHNILKQMLHPEATP